MTARWASAVCHLVCQLIIRKYPLGKPEIKHRPNFEIIDFLSHTLELACAYFNTQRLKTTN